MYNLVERIIALMLFILSIPIYLILFPIIKGTSSGPFIFRQKRVGKNKAEFTIYKFRTMINDSEQLKGEYIALNELTAPFFKIEKDPRHTRIGRFLASFGLDEIPQLVNVMKGEMSFVGPRPFPVEESKEIPSKYNKRYTVLPGLTGHWVLIGFHRLTFKQWMESDCNYVQKKNPWYDITVSIKTVCILIKSLVKKHD